MTGRVGSVRIPTLDRTSTALRALAQAAESYPETAIRYRDDLVSVHQLHPSLVLDLVRGLHNPSVERRKRDGAEYFIFRGNLFPAGIWPLQIVVDQDDETEAAAMWVSEVSS